MKKPENDIRPISQRIKENSILDFINTVSQLDIEKMGFKSRKEYYNNQLNIMYKKKDIICDIEGKKNHL